jgi:hypothetical protein
VANFEVFGKCDVKKHGQTIETITELLRSSLSKHYEIKDLTATPTGLTVNGDIKSFWERAITVADVQVRLESNELSYRVSGSSTLGKWPYIWFVVGVLVNVLFGFGGYFFIGWAVGTGIEYLICRDRPKQYMEQAFKAVQFEIG